LGRTGDEGFVVIVGGRIRRGEVVEARGGEGRRVTGCRRGSRRVVRGGRGGRREEASTRRSLGAQ
jgi:hypothetical protein